MINSWVKFNLKPYRKLVSEMKHPDLQTYIPLKYSVKINKKTFLIKNGGH
jgi:hypothetical protein